MRSRTCQVREPKETVVNKEVKSMIEKGIEKEAFHKRIRTPSSRVSNQDVCKKSGSGLFLFGQHDST